MKIIVICIVYLLTFNNSIYSQKIIEMEKINGTYQIPCKVNGIPMKFIFDTGASDVTISITEANFMIKQGLLTSEDIIGKTNYEIANGDIIEGTQIYLKTIEIGNLTLKNVKASVINKQNSPLLLGQTAISKLGKYSINKNYLIIENSQKSEEINKPKEIKEIVNFLNEYLSLKSWGPTIDAKYEYNDYSKSLAYKAKATLNDTENSSREIDYIIKIDDVLKIDEVKSITRLS
jgi:clan AA aspartic protease (TIGR02281 family)